MARSRPAASMSGSMARFRTKAQSRPVFDCGSALALRAETCCGDAKIGRDAKNCRTKNCRLWRGAIAGPAVRSLKPGFRLGPQIIRNSAIKSVIKPQCAASNSIVDADDPGVPPRGLSEPLSPGPSISSARFWPAGGYRFRVTFRPALFQPRFQAAARMGARCRRSSDHKVASAPGSRLAVSHLLETQTALALLRCRIFGRKTGFHPRSSGGHTFPEKAPFLKGSGRHRHRPTISSTVSLIFAMA
jgi:hypothetical protein